MAEVERDQTGKFAPGSSGNPGGRPRRDEVVRRLAGREGGQAVKLLVQLLGGTAGVIVIDARDVLAELLEEDLGGAPERPPPLPDGVLERLLEHNRLSGEFERGWVSVPGLPPRRRNAETGEVLAFGPWADLRERHIAAGLALWDAARPAPAIDGG